MARNGKQDVPLVVGLFLMVLAMVSLGNLGLNIANSRDIAKTNARLNAFINKDSHGQFAPITKRESSDGVAALTQTDDDTPLELIPHPVYTNVMMSKMIYPNATRNEVVERAVNPYVWWGLGVFKLADSGWAIYNLVTSCRSWAGSEETSDSRKAGCVYG